MWLGRILENKNGPLPKLISGLMISGGNTQRDIRVKKKKTIVGWYCRKTRRLLIVTTKTPKVLTNWEKINSWIILLNNLEPLLHD